MIKNSTRLLHISYWTGAVMDGIVAVTMIFPGILIRVYGLQNFQPDPAFIFSFRFGAALMLGWTALLLWADRKPVERRGVLPLTMFVIIGLILSEVYAVISGFIVFQEMLPTFLIQTALFILFTFSFMTSKNTN